MADMDKFATGSLPVPYQQSTAPLRADHPEWAEYVEWAGATDWPALRRCRLKPSRKYEEFKNVRTFTIELRADYLDDDKFRVLETAMKQAAKHVYTTALLLQDKRKPEIALYGSDFFASRQEIELADDINEEEEANDAPTDQDAGPAE
jgi:hypothetical protein